MSSEYLEMTSAANNSLKQVDNHLIRLILCGLNILFLTKVLNCSNRRGKMTKPQLHRNINNVMAHHLVRVIKNAAPEVTKISVRP